MKIFSPSRSKLIKAEQASKLAVLPLTLEQRIHEAAVKSAANVNLNKVIEIELAKLFNDSSFSIEVTPCSYSAIYSWFNEAPRVFVKSASFVPEDEDTYLSFDYQSANRMADLCLGGVLNPVSKKTPDDSSAADESSATDDSSAADDSSATDDSSAADDSSTTVDNSASVERSKSELSATEARICGRLLQRQIQGIQYLLFKERGSLAAEICKDKAIPNSLNHLAFKVRLILEAEVISWFIWLPVSFFSTSKVTHGHNTDAQPLSMACSHKFIVKGCVEMASKKVTLKQLKACMNGAILPIELNTPALFKLGKTTFLKGQVAEQDANLTFQITDIPEKSEL
ncbi:flagellar motor switch protein FliM [Colwellia sp. 20A7]|uniref:flagellar motor switch protein FliM n=1 Tax=Colwellia sp. 20A7 TaxID=2689569 RepID=UPI001359BBAF|nr:flagellar motor switch protein FliM [Colwellia sp. 20A7]